MGSLEKEREKPLCNQLNSWIMTEQTLINCPIEYGGHPGLYFHVASQLSRGVSATLGELPG